MTFTNRLRHLTLSIVVQAAVMLTAIAALFLLVSYWTGILPDASTTLPELWVWVGLAVVLAGSIGEWWRSWWVTKAGPRVQALEERNSMGELVPRVQYPHLAVPAASILLACAWAFQQTVDPSVRLRLWAIDTLSWLAATRFPAGMCVLAGLIAIVWYIRSAAINARGISRMPELRQIAITVIFLLGCIMLFVLFELSSASRLWEWLLAMSGLLTQVTWSVHRSMAVVGSVLLTAVLVSALRFGTITDLWYSKAEAYNLLVIVSSAVLASRSVLVGVVWMLVWGVAGYRVGDLIGWLRPSRLPWSSALEGTRWLAILTSLIWVIATPRIAVDIVESHIFLITAFAMAIYVYGPIYLFPDHRPQSLIRDVLAKTETLQALKTVQESAMHASGSYETKLLLLAEQKLKLSRIVEYDATELMQAALVDLDGAHWICSREEWPGILEGEHVALDTWLGLEDLDKDEKWIAIQQLAKNSSYNEACLRLMVYACWLGSFVNDDWDTNQVDMLYQRLHKEGNEQRVVTRWLLWRVFFSRYPDPVDESIQQEKLLTGLEAIEPLDVLSAFPPDLWMSYEADELQLLRIAEHSAWRAVVIAGQLSGTDKAGSLFLRCVQEWKEVRHTLMLAELNPLALRTVSTTTQPSDCERITQVLNLAELRRPARRQAEAWLRYTELLTALAKDLLLKQMIVVAEGLKECLRDRIAEGFTLPKAEITGPPLVLWTEVERD